MTFNFLENFFYFLEASPAHTAKPLKILKIVIGCTIKGRFRAFGIQFEIRKRILKKILVTSLFVVKVRQVQERPVNSSNFINQCFTLVVDFGTFRLN